MLQESRYCSVKDRQFDAVAGELLQVLERFKYAFAAEAVERPEQNDIELAARSGEEQLCELRALRAFLDAHVVYVLVNNRPTLSLAELTQLNKLVPHILAFIDRGDPSVKSYPHALIVHEKIVP